jgi:anti-sigma regulatory factor (Ser/Thr protein kinase)
VEWYVDAGDAQNVRKLRWAVNEYLAERASADSDLATAAVVVTELVGNVHVHARGPATVRLEWCGELPTLTVANLGPEFAPEITAPDPLAESGRGLYMVEQLVGKVTIRHDPDTGVHVSVKLPIRRGRDAPANEPEASQVS